MSPNDEIWNIPRPAGWQLPAWNEARLVETPVPLAGECAYKLIDARIIDNPGSHNIFVEVITEDNERDHLAEIHFQNADDSVQIKTEEKPMDEPMTNVPMEAGDTYKVWVGNRPSDVVLDIHGRYADHPEDGTTWGHVPYLLQFQRVIGEEGGPEPEETLEQFLRRKTWDTIGVDWNPDAAFTKYAEDYNLGKPEYNEFDLVYDGVEYRVQPFTAAIVLCVVGDWQNIQHIRWNA